MGLRLTTKIQVSGWRFLLRRLEHAIVRRDTRMFDDPIQFYGRSLTVGIVIAVFLIAASGVLAYFRPQGKLGDGDLFADGSTYQLFVRMSGRLHPVFNLTSARLVLNTPADPAVVATSELDELPKGQPIGIPGAPYSTPVTTTSSSWAVCDSVANPDSAAPSVQTAVISMPLITDSDIDPITAREAMLASYGEQDWVITQDGRHALDRTNRALTSALGIPSESAALPISEGLYNALPDAGAWQLPPIAAAGEPNTLGLPEELVVGSVFQMHTPQGASYYVVLSDGVAPVNYTTAAALRATESYGLATPPAVEPSVVIPLPERSYASPLPSEQVTMLSRHDAATLCWTWERGPGNQAAISRTVAGPRLPIPPTAMTAGISQIGSGTTIYIDNGKYIELQSPDPEHGEALYYVDPRGIRYGLADSDTATALGLGTPVPAPWQAVRLLVDGPVLSRDAALVEHDTLGDPANARKVSPGDG